MKTEKTYNEDLYNIEKNLIQRKKQEILATGKHVLKRSLQLTGYFEKVFLNPTGYSV